jgi:dUTP pyrophosphatase
MDLRSTVDAIIKPGQCGKVPVGIKMAIPEGYEAQIRSRSGLALVHGMVVLNSPGTIDSDFRGEVHVLLNNISNKPFVIKRGDFIAQMVFAPVARALFDPVLFLDDTTRGEGGFGSTG